MGDHVAEPKLTPLEYLRTRAKAAIFVVGAALIGVVSSFLADPATAEALAGFVPEAFRPLVPVVLIAVGGIILERVPNAKEDEIREKKAAALAA